MNVRYMNTIYVIYMRIAREIPLYICIGCADSDKGNRKVVGEEPLKNCFLFHMNKSAFTYNNRIGELQHVNRKKITFVYY